MLWNVCDPQLENLNVLLKISLDTANSIKLNLSEFLASKGCQFQNAFTFTPFGEKCMLVGPKIHPPTSS